jgi:Fe-S cluster assembly scaffold protein SufB
MIGEKCGKQLEGMGMKNVRKVNFLQVNSDIRRLLTEEGVIVLPSSQAYEKLKWTRDYFEQKPEEGYFIWVKKQISHPLITCIAISSPKISQNPRNLIVIERDVKAEVHSVCNTMKKNLYGSHIGRTKVILKEQSTLQTRHFHKWESGDTVSSSLQFHLQKGATLFHVYRCLTVPEKLKTELNSFLDSSSSANIETAVLAKRGNINMYDSTFLNGEEASAVIKVRMVADQGSKITSRSKMIANNAGIGHLDCMGLLLSEKSSISTVPELINRNKNATLTHEASVGRISQEALNYLRSRGLTEDGAIGLIVTGFLREAAFSYKGRVLPSKTHM